MNKTTLFFFVLIFISSALFAQEVVTDLSYNPVLIRKYVESENRLKKIISAKVDTLQLPFLDDFSKNSIYPDPLFWLDSNIFINRDYPIAPPSIGVATFEGLRKTGLPYDTTQINTDLSLPADTLTSRPINLALLPSDSVYFSFYWQAKGRGNDPEINDSLVLEFLNPSTKIWRRAWSKAGYNPFNSDSIFRSVLLSIKDTALLKNGFQFRFRNYATSGNVDHWHIDYVYLDKHRNQADTTFSDVAFIYNTSSLLKNYSAMPWEQYRPSEMKTNLSFFIRNNDTIIKNTTFKDTIYNAQRKIEASYNGGGLNVLPYKKGGLVKDALFANPTLSGYTFPLLSDTATFTLKGFVNTTPDKDRWNDTLQYMQHFGNYYAYDDGTVEAGYGLNVYGGQIAYKFTLNTTDTLVGVQMLFNWVPPNVHQREFRICIWGDNGGTPGTLLFMDSIVTPNYQFINHSNWGNMINEFYPYKLSSKKIISGTFYVGWIQYTTDLLNIGFDRNTNTNRNMFFNVGNGWSQSVIAGSWMIRPVFRDLKSLINVDDISSTKSFILYPNPSTGKAIIQITGDTNNEFAKYYITVLTITGQVVYSEATLSSTHEMDLSNLTAGLYFVQVRGKNGVTLNQKLILTK